MDLRIRRTEVGLRVAGHSDLEAPAVCKKSRNSDVSPNTVLIPGVLHNAPRRVNASIIMHARCSSCRKPSDVEVPVFISGWEESEEIAQQIRDNERRSRDSHSGSGRPVLTTKRGTRMAAHLARGATPSLLGLGARTSRTPEASRASAS